MFILLKLIKLENIYLADNYNLLINSISVINIFYRYIKIT